MSDRAAFLARICAEPDEDTHRLVYADWLDEFGDAGDRDRAELIRVQCERAVLGDEADHGDCDCKRCRRYLTLRVSSLALLAGHPEWSRCPCPACGYTIHAGYDDTGECSTCGGTGDLFRDDSLEVVGGACRVIDWHAGWPRSLSCTLDKVLRKVRRGCDVRTSAPAGVEVAPWARAVVAAVPVTRLVPVGLEPTPWRGSGVFGWATTPQSPATLPEGLFYKVRLLSPDPARLNVWPTAVAAVDALAVTLATLARTGVAA